MKMSNGLIYFVLTIFVCSDVFGRMAYDYDDHMMNSGRNRSDELRERKEITDSSKLIQSSTQKDTKKRETNLDKFNYCRTRSGLWMKRADSGFINCMNMPESEKK